MIVFKTDKAVEGHCNICCNKKAEVSISYGIERDKNNSHVHTAVFCKSCADMLANGVLDYLNHEIPIVKKFL